MGGTTLQLEYDSKSINIPRLANLLVSLSQEQKERLELLLDKGAMATLMESEEDIKKGRTISIEKWQ